MMLWLLLVISFEQVPVVVALQTTVDSGIMGVNQSWGFLEVDSASNDVRRSQAGVLMGRWNMAILVIRLMTCVGLIALFLPPL